MDAGVLADHGLLKGKRIAIDATTLEANAAMRSIEQRDTGENYEEFLVGLANATRPGSRSRPAKTWRDRIASVRSGCGIRSGRARRPAMGELRR